MSEKKIYKDLILLVNTINNNAGKQETKIQKKLGKFGDKIKPYLEKYQEKTEEIRLDNAATDDKGVLTMGEKGDYKFTKDGLKKCNEQLKTLFEAEFDYTPIEVLNPKGLEELTYLKGWVNGVDFIEVEKEIEEEL